MGSGLEILDARVGVLLTRTWEVEAAASVAGVRAGVLSLRLDLVELIAAFKIEFVDCASPSGASLPFPLPFPFGVGEGASLIIRVFFAVIGVFVGVFTGVLTGVLLEGLETTVLDLRR